MRFCWWGKPWKKTAVCKNEKFTSPIRGGCTPLCPPGGDRGPSPYSPPPFFVVPVIFSIYIYMYPPPLSRGGVRGGV